MLGNSFDILKDVVGVMVLLVIFLETSRNLLCCKQQLLFVGDLAGAVFIKDFLIQCDDSVVGAESTHILHRRGCRRGQKLVVDSVSDR